MSTRHFLLLLTLMLWLGAHTPAPERAGPIAVNFLPLVISQDEARARADGARASS